MTENHYRQTTPLLGTRNPEVSHVFVHPGTKQLNWEHATFYIINVGIWLQNTDKFVGMLHANTFFMKLKYFLALLLD